MKSRTALRAAAACGLLGWAAGVALAAPGPPAPRVQGAPGGPPPAWVETAGGDRWLAFGSFCWRTTCVDFIPPELRPDLPRLTLRRGEIVRFHLAFPARSVTLRVSTRTFRLSPGRIATWRAAGAGVTVLAIQAAQGSASYVARLVAGDPRD